jgi:hypothetical protein
MTPGMAIGGYAGGRIKKIVAAWRWLNGLIAVYCEDCSLSSLT